MPKRFCKSCKQMKPYIDNNCKGQPLLPGESLLIVVLHLCAVKVHAHPLLLTPAMKTFKTQKVALLLRSTVLSSLVSCGCVRPYRTEGALGSRFVYGETAARMFVYISTMAVMRLSFSRSLEAFRMY